MCYFPLIKSTTSFKFSITVLGRVLEFIFSNFFLRCSLRQYQTHPGRPRSPHPGRLPRYVWFYSYIFLLFILFSPSRASCWVSNCYVWMFQCYKRKSEGGDFVTVDSHYYAERNDVWQHWSQLRVTLTVESGESIKISSTNLCLLFVGKMFIWYIIKQYIVMLEMTIIVIIMRDFCIYFCISPRSCNNYIMLYW